MKRKLIDAAAVVVVVVVGVAVHYVAGVDWPSPIVIGAAASIVARLVVRGTVAARE